MIKNNNRSYFLVMIGLALLLAGCAATPVRNAPITNQGYPQIEPQGQVSPATVKELEQRYPDGFWQQERMIPAGQEKRVSIKTFSANPAQANQAQAATQIFASVFARSNAFVVVEREQLDGIIDEFELNQSGLMNQNNAPETGNMDTAQIIITGDIIQMGGANRLQARAVDMTSGRVLISEKSNNIPVITAQAAEMLARRLISGLQEILYPR